MLYAIKWHLLAILRSRRFFWHPYCHIHKWHISDTIHVNYVIFLSFMTLDNIFIFLKDMAGIYFVPHNTTQRGKSINCYKRKSTRNRSLRVPQNIWYLRRYKKQDGIFSCIYPPFLVSAMICVKKADVFVSEQIVKEGAWEEDNVELVLRAISQYQNAVFLGEQSVVLNVLSRNVSFKVIQKTITCNSDYWW